MEDEIENEVAKRLTPKTKVLRELFSKSGNPCAFPGCHQPMIDGNGNFVGEVCHIEAAEPGGERFNSSMTNEERREYDNLILMCHEHHVVTDNVSEYPVEKMKLIKQKHEEKYSGTKDFPYVHYWKIIKLGGLFGMIYVIFAKEQMC